MAWDSKASPWDWGIGTVLLQRHGDDQKREQAHDGGWASEAEACLAGPAVPHSGGATCVAASGTGLLPAFSSAPPKINDVQAGSIGRPRSNFASVDQTIPVLSSSTNNNRSFIIDCNDDCRGKDPGIGSQKKTEDNGKKIEETNAGFLELRSHPSGYKNSAGANRDGKGNHLVAEKHQMSSIKPERQGRLFLPGGGSHQDKKEAWLIEEQHSSTATGSAGSGDSLIGLHLGKRTYFEDSTTGGAGTRTAKKPPASSNSAPPKKSRAGAAQPPRCQVEGCNTDLTSAKDYHRRHKVCDTHSKARRVIVASLEQRFCQQCSRFHLLAEFDEAKRSCRKRLAGHNERRRKPQPDPLALNARLSSAFQGWPSFFHHPRFTGISSLQEDSGDFRSMPWKGTWPRMMNFPDQLSNECTVPAPGIERELFLTGLSPHPNDKLPLMLLQSPKETTSMPHNLYSQRVHDYLPGSIGPMGNGLTLSSSSAVFSGLDATPATQVVTRITDSGRALSLLSPQTQGFHALDPVWLGLPIRTSITVDQFMNEDETAVPGQFVQGGQQQHFDYAMEKLFSIASSSRNHLSASGATAVGLSSMEKDHYAGAVMNSLNGVGSFEEHPFLGALQGHGSKSPQDLRPTIDLMPTSSQSQSAPSQGSFQLGSSPYGELQYSYESTFF